MKLDSNDALILTPFTLYSLVASGVSAAGLSGGAITTTTLAALGLGFGMTGGLVVLGVSGLIARGIVRRISHHQSN